MSNKLKLIQEINENQKVYRGDIFIVPNKASIPIEVKGDFKDINNRFSFYTQEKLDEEIEFFGKETINICLENNLPTYKAFGVRDCIDSYGKEFLKDHQIECWVTGGENGKNWNDHGLQKEELLNLQFGNKGKSLFPSYFPESFFKDKKEDDHILLQVEDTDIVFDLKLNQKDYRYREYGNFENALKCVTA